ncbi:HNH endonuclease signature motif containing protein, partial [Mycolicibacterium fortuitum]|uniref:HNH endonuclease signature motif containing protein n=1 Tax=Mycolicibacterium fortuitum TaxID=1766 RepID=UPI000AB17873
PCTSGTPTQAQIDNDHRSLAQRQHDALLVVGRIALMTDLGQLNGLPVSLIIRTTVQDLQSRAGVGISGGGTKIPIKDVLRMAAHAHHFLAVFDQASGSALNLFRARRVASPAQRIMLIARDGGCTKPGCTVGAYGCQAHHATADWAAGGNTNVDDMALACGPDNRLVDDDGGYSTTLTSDGVVQWHPPPELDHGQHRINYLHRPELLLTPPEPARAPADLTPDPTWEWERGPGPHQRSQPAPAPRPDPDLRPQPELDPDPDWDIKPHQQHEPDTEWDVDWNTNWDNDFNPPTLSTPSVEHLWDPEPYALEIIEPEIPAGWTLLDTPDPWQPISNSNAVSGKAVRGP